MSPTPGTRDQVGKLRQGAGSGCRSAGALTPRLTHLGGHGGSAPLRTAAVPPSCAAASLHPLRDGSRLLQLLGGQGVRGQRPSPLHPQNAALALPRAGGRPSHPIAVGEHGVEEAVQVPVQTLLAPGLPKFPVCRGTRRDEPPVAGLHRHGTARHGCTGTASPAAPGDRWRGRCPTGGGVRIRGRQRGGFHGRRRRHFI